MIDPRTCPDHAQTPADAAPPRARRPCVPSWPRRPRWSVVAVDRLDGPTAWLLTLGGVFAVCLIAFLDYENGPELSLSVFYLIPVGICAWWGGFAHGLIIALAGAVAWDLVDSLENPTIPAVFGLWNGIVRCGTSVIVSALVSRVHAGAIRERILARTDPLTGAANGRTFYEAVVAESERAGRTHRPMTLAYFDVDDFKQLNDRLGHAAGDAALVALVNLIRLSLRSTDVLARLGGDEFALLLPETEGAGAVAMLTRLQDLLADAMARAGHGVTVSIGAVTFLSPAWDVDRMVQQIDALMYAAKRRGKNRVEHVTLRDVGDLENGSALRLERRAIARTVCRRTARVRQDGEDAAADVPATVVNLTGQGIALRTDRLFAVQSLLVIEPLAHPAKPVLAKVIHVAPSAGGWLHGCELPIEMSGEEVAGWLHAQPYDFHV